MPALFGKAYRMLVTEGYAQERTFFDKEISQWLGVNTPDMWHSFMPDLPGENDAQSKH